MTATVYIIGWNGDQWLPACLENLHRASTHRIQLVLIDNHNNPGIAALPLGRFDTRVVKTPKEMVFADAHNFGIVAAPPKTELVVLLNQDTKSENGWIDCCADEFTADPRLGVAMPGVRNYDDNGWDVNFLVCARRNPDLGMRLEGGSLGPAEEGAEQHCFRVPMVTGAAMVVRTEVLWEVGLFDPVFGSYYEDYDFCRRASGADWSVGICQRACVYHFDGSATDSKEAELRRHRWVLRNRVIHEARLAGNNRIRYLIGHFALDVPRRLARALLGTPSSQPVRAILKANLSLLKLAPRLISRARDRREWRSALVAMEWPKVAPEVIRATAAELEH